MPTLCRDCLSLTDEIETACPGCGSRRVVADAELADLTIAHVDCDAFYAAVEKRDDPSLRDKPVIVGHPGRRGVVTTACYVARRFGPRSAMPMFKALDLCPDAVVIPPNMTKYKEASRAIRAIMRTYTEALEPVSLDEAYLDLAPDVRRDGRPPAVLLAEMGLRIEREVGLTVSVGLSANKFLAKLASDLEKPRGFAVIGREGATAALADMPVRRILGVGEATARRLAELGIATIGDLQIRHEEELVRPFGAFGRRLARYARGEDERAVTPERPLKSVSAETTFASDLRRTEDLIVAVRPLCERVAERLSRSGLAGRTVVLKLKSADFRVRTRNRSLGDPTRRAEVILGAAASLIRKEATGVAFRLVGVGVTDLCSADLADPPTLFDVRSR